MAKSKREGWLPADELDAGDLLGSVLLRGKKLRGEVAERVTTADASVGITRIGEVAFTIYDPGFILLKRRLFVLGTSVVMEQFNQEISAVETSAGPDGRGQVIVRCRARAVGRLKRRRGRKVMRNASPTDFVVSECRAVGARVVAQATAKRKNVARDVSKSKRTADSAPSTWTTFERLAREVGFVVFESGGTIYFGKPSWLRKRDSKAAVITYETNPNTDTVSVPAFQDSLEERGTTVQFTVPRSRLAEFMPGQRVNVKMDVPYANQVYLVTDLSLQVAGPGLLSVTAGRPVDPEREGVEGAGRKKKDGKGEDDKKDRRTSRAAPAAGDGDGQGAAGAGRVIVGPSELATLLREVGFEGRGLDVAAGVAVAESGRQLHDRWHVDAGMVSQRGASGKWGPRVGVFGIQSLRRPGDATGVDRLRVRSKLVFPVFNARAAYALSNGGQDWSRFPAYASGAYKPHLGRLEVPVLGWERSAAGAHEEAAGLANTSIEGRLSSLDFTRLCLEQARDAAILTERVVAGDDCSELVEWAADVVGCFMPPDPDDQMAYMTRKGTTLEPAAALRTRGALLWRPGTVAVSLGAGRGTIEAVNGEYGIRPTVDTAGWISGGRVPGMTYG